MAVKPKRTNPMSTRPVYLPRVPAKELREAANAGSAVEGAAIRILIDGAIGLHDARVLAERVSDYEERPVTFEGDLVSVLARLPQTEVRQAVAALGHHLAWARIRDVTRQDYRVLPLRGEVDEEETRFLARSQPEYAGVSRPAASTGLLYDAAEVQSAYRELLPSGEEGDLMDIVITDRRLVLWDARAKGWTPLTILPGTPFLVSMGGQQGFAAGDALLEAIRKALSP